MISQRIEPVFTERYESGESVLSAQVNSVKGVYLNKLQTFFGEFNQNNRFVSLTRDMSATPKLARVTPELGFKYQLKRDNIPKHVLNQVFKLGLSSRGFKRLPCCFKRIEIES